MRRLAEASLQRPCHELQGSPHSGLPVFCPCLPIHHTNVAEVMHHNYWHDNCVKIYVSMWLFSHIIPAIQNNPPCLLRCTGVRSKYDHCHRYLTSFIIN